ncbi:MAG: chromosomal replication initiator DnaA [Alphaproteobacteria bacterium]|nr:chromosomal replication initiator DnaA [Alphaproteobacteria bacterium]
MGLAGYAVGVPVEAIATTQRGCVEAAFGRQLAMYLCHVAFEMSLSRVAYAFARDRSTAAHACHMIEDRREDPGFDAWADALETALREAPAPDRRRVAGR